MTAGEDFADNVISLLRHRAKNAGQKAAVIFVADPSDAENAETLTYGQLDDQARRIGSWLQKNFAAGTRVLLLSTTGLEFVTAFFGCVYAGMIPVPAPQPGRHQHQRRRVQTIAHDAGVATVIASEADLPAVREWIEATRLDLRHPATDASQVGDPTAWTPPSVDRRTVMLLQYTSGSTSEPKGVMVTHGNLLHNTVLIGQSLDLTEHSRMGGWLPLYHDMGLIGQLILPLLLGGTAVLMSPTAFTRRPIEWLRIVNRFGLSMSPAPNFAFELCGRRITDQQIAELDLSQWPCAVNGSEPVHAPTLASFAERFAPAGFRAEAITPCFGLAEATLYVCGRRGRRPVVRRVAAALLEKGEFRTVPNSEPGRELVGLGQPHGFDVRIVNPETREVLPDGRIGEIWLRGDSVAEGYWERKALTEQVFQATTADGDGGYLRTGDAGVLFDGELFVTGRLKETLVIRGRNLFPQDLEHEVRLLHDGLAKGVGAVFSVCTPEEEVVVTHEIHARGEATDMGEIADNIRLSLGREFGVRVAGVVLLRPGGVRRTTSGKIQRLAMRELFLAGVLDPVYEDVSLAVRELRNSVSN